MRTRSGLSYCDTSSANTAENYSSKMLGEKSRKKVVQHVRYRECQKCHKFQMELEAKESDLAGERKATELAEHKLSESRDQVAKKIPLNDCQGCKKVQLQLEIKEAECTEELKLRKSAESTTAKLNEKVHALQKELEIEKSWGKHVKKLIDKIPPALLGSEVNCAPDALVDEVKKERDFMKQYEASLKKEIERLKSSNKCLTDENIDLQKLIASQECSFEDFRQWVEDNFINKMGFTIFSAANVDEMVTANAVIGSGGYGQVYKASFDDKDVAVKILNPGSGQGLREFETEVNILKKVHHKNIIHLIGACPCKHALVYEFLGNGTLHERLYADPCLPWQKRISIAFDICSALVFLQKMKPGPIVHCDLKPDNILFDAEDTPKICDFGISYELSEVSETGSWHYVTVGTPRGTPTYIDPEFQCTGKVTPCADTHAFGVLLLQLVTGQGSSKFAGFVEEQIKKLERGKQRSSPLQRKVIRSLRLIDNNLGVDDWNPKAVVLLLKLGLACTHEDRKRRPSLSGYVWPQLYMIREESLFC